MAQAEATGLRYQEGVVHLEMGQRLGDLEHLQQAKSIFMDIGAVLDLAKAKEALTSLGD